MQVGMKKLGGKLIFFYRETHDANTATKADLFLRDKGKLNKAAFQLFNHRISCIIQKKCKNLLIQLSFSTWQKQNIFLTQRLGNIFTSDVSSIPGVITNTFFVKKSYTLST